MNKILKLMLISLLIISTYATVNAQDEIKIWKDFTQKLKNGEITAERIKPYYESLKEPLLGFLKQIKENVDWKSFETAPEIFKVKDQVHYVISLKFGEGKRNFCFSFFIEEGNWFFQHLEAIFIRLDKTGDPPVSTFPDLPEERKAWMREEIRIGRQVRTYNELKNLKSKEYALNWFKDGAGFFLRARTWCPLVETTKAFILYACWEQANLRVNKVTLEKLEEDEAVIKMQLDYLALYERAAHLKQQISYEEYIQIFETIWKDRALNAGWEIDIKYLENFYCMFTFKKT